MSTQCYCTSSRLSHHPPHGSMAGQHRVYLLHTRSWCQSAIGHCRGTDSGSAPPRLPALLEAQQAGPAAGHQQQSRLRQCYSAQPVRHWRQESHTMQQDIVVLVFLPRREKVNRLCKEDGSRRRAGGGTSSLDQGCWI